MSELRPRYSTRWALAVGLATAMIAFSWQSLTAHFNYGGNWTAFFCTGTEYAVPPPLVSENIHIFRNSSGYDGQFYHYIAHDPFLQKGWEQHLDSPDWRYRRIFVPLAAFLLAGGQQAWVDQVYFTVILLSVFFGAYWLSQYSQLHGIHPAWGLGFLAVPAVIISLDRMTVDITLVALAAGFALYVKTGPAWKLYAVLACACLTRETGFLLLGAYGLYLLWNRRIARALVFGTAAAPAIAWLLFVQTRIAPGQPRRYLLHVSAVLPGEVLLERFFTPVSYPLPPAIAWTAVALDYLALLGVVAALLLGIRAAVTKRPGALEFAALFFALMIVLLGNVVGWYEPFGFSRTLSPLLLFLGMRGVIAGSWLDAVPLLMILPRIILQMGPQALGVLQGLKPG